MLAIPVFYILAKRVADSGIGMSERETFDTFSQTECRAFVWPLGPLSITCAEKSRPHLPTQKCAFQV